MSLGKVKTVALQEMKANMMAGMAYRGESSNPGISHYTIRYGHMWTDRNGTVEGPMLYTNLASDAHLLPVRPTLLTWKEALRYVEERHYKLIPGV